MFFSVSHTQTRTHSLTHSLSLSLSHTHTHTHTHTWQSIYSAELSIEEKKHIHLLAWKTSTVSVSIVIILIVTQHRQSLEVSFKKFISSFTIIFFLVFLVSSIVWIWVYWKEIVKWSYNINKYSEPLIIFLEVSCARHCARYFVM